MVVIEGGGMSIMGDQNIGQFCGCLGWSEYKVALHWSCVVVIEGIVVLVLDGHTRGWRCGVLVWL